MISADSGAEVIVLSWQLNKESIKKGKRETKREKLRERERETPIGRWKSANPNIDGRSSAVSSDSLAGDFLLGRVEDWQNGRRYLFGGFPFFLLLFLLFPSLSLSLSFLLFFFPSLLVSLFCRFCRHFCTWVRHNRPNALQWPPFLQQMNTSFIYSTLHYICSLIYSKLLSLMFMTAIIVNMATWNNNFPFFLQIRCKCAPSKQTAQLIIGLDFKYLFPLPNHLLESSYSYQK